MKLFKSLPPAFLADVRTVLAKRAEEVQKEFGRYDILPILKSKHLLEEHHLTAEAVESYLYRTAIDEIMRKQKQSCSTRGGFFAVERLGQLGETGVAKLKFCSKPMVGLMYQVDYKAFEDQLKGWERKKGFYDELTNMWKGYSPRTMYQEILQHRKRKK